MQEKSFSKKTPSLRFRRYSRSGYAVFNSLHREVTIGAVATYIADRGVCKSLCSLALCASLLGGAAMAQTDREAGSQQLPTLEITATVDSLQTCPGAVTTLTRSDIENLPIRSVADLVAILPGVDLRIRGGNDVQNDLSMRGSTIDQMIVLVNGVNLTDPQTGHHNLDIPIDLDMVQRIELLTASDLMSRGMIGFAGGVNIVVSEEYADRLTLLAAGGSYGQAKFSASATKVIGPWMLTAAATYNRSDGYMDNTDYRYGNLFVQAQRHSISDDWHLQIGAQTKDFGSQAFYSTTYPNQFEATRTVVASATNIHRFKRSRIETTLYGRLHKDRFELFRDGYAEAPAWYSGHNRHLSNSEGLRSQWLMAVGPGTLTAGIDARHDGILSNVLGETLEQPREPYTKSAERFNVSAFGGYGLTFLNTKVSAHLLGNRNSRFGYNYGFAAAAEYSFNSHLNATASLSRTYRLPTFTDLYYHSATQLSNPNLKPENALCAEAAVAYRSSCLQLTADIYYRHGNNIIDWVREPSETVWHSMNHSDVGAVGGDLSAIVSPRGVPFQVGAVYSYCHIGKDSGTLISNYALDYLSHKAEAFVAYKPLRNLTLRTALTVRKREGSYTDASGNVVHYPTSALLNASAQYKLGITTLFVEGYNLLNASYCDYGGVPQPGLTLMGGVKINLQK